MFLDVLLRRNKEFIDAAIALHQAGQIPANAYVLDLDAVEENSRAFATEAEKFGLKTFAMTKQVGRHAGFCRAVLRGGIERCVAVDTACGVACHRNGLPVGHLGHLVQVPHFETDMAAAILQPDYWTVYSDEKAAAAATSAGRAGREQQLLTRIQTDGDIFYHGHEGGFAAEDIVAVAERIDGLDHASFAGITTFPALLYDNDKRAIEPTPNLTTLAKARERLEQAGRSAIEVNAPGTTSSVVIKALADAGATQCEPGNGLHGTTPLHAISDLVERPAVAYLSEVSHLHAQRAYCFGGGLYIDPVFPDYDVKAVVASEPPVGDIPLASVDIPPPAAIDYYGMIDCSGSVKPQVGDSVVFGFRGQAFVTRAFIVGIAGISSGQAKVDGIANIFGQEVNWPTCQA